MSSADEAVHAVTPGATAAAVYLMLAKLDRLPDIREVAGATPKLSLVPLVTLVGLGLATVCEFEGVEKQYSPRARTSDANDTISDLALGGMGLVIAGASLVFWFHLRRRQRQTK